MIAPFPRPSAMVPSLVRAGLAHLKLVAALAAVGGISALAYALGSDEAMSRDVSRERGHLLALVASLERTYGERGYDGLSMERALADRAVPGPMLRSEGHPVRNAWGLPVTLAPHTVRSRADGFTVTYHGVPRRDCEGLAMSLSPEVHDLRINGRGVMGALGAERGLVEGRCASGQGVPMEFVFHRDLVPGTAVLR